MIFNINYPTAVVIGEDASSKTGEKLKELGIAKALCVYDQGIKSVGVVDKIMQNIQAQGIEVVEYGGVVSDPPDTVIDAAGELGKKEGVDAIIGIGGGSCLDTAKAANVLLGNPGPINRYFGFGIPQNPGKTLILIPTTSGTGSEVSQVAAITDTASGMKLPVAGPNCTAALAIVDPLLTLALPPKLTAATGVDTLAHAIEAYTSALSNPIADILSLEAISLAAKSLRTAVKEGSNIQARFNMSFACTLAGMAFTQAFPHIGHAIGTPLGGRYHLAHGLTVAVVLPGAVEFISDVMPEKVKTIAKAIGLNLPEDLSSEAVGLAIGDAIRQLNKEIGLPTLKEMNIPETDLPVIAAETFENPCANFTPKKATPEDVVKLLQKEYAI